MSFKSNVDSQIRGFWFAPNGSDSSSGESLEVPFLTIQKGIDAAAALIPPPSFNINGLVNASQGGTFSDSFILSDSINLGGIDCVLTVDDTVAVTMASALLFNFTGIVNNQAAGICMKYEDVSFSAVNVLFVSILGDSGIAMDISGATSNLSISCESVSLSAENAIGYNITSNATVDPIQIDSPFASLNADNNIFMNYDPGNSDSECVISSGSITSTAAFSTGYVVTSGHLGITVNILDVDTAIHVKTGAIACIYANDISGDIIVDSGGTLRIVCLHHHEGVITNNGTIDGIINGVRFGNWITDLDQIQLIYVSKAGDNLNSGLNINVPKLTISEAVSDALSLTPAVDNQITIEVIDSGTYAENVNLPEWVHINAVNAALDGRLTIEDNTISRFRRLQNSDTGGPVARKIDGLGFAKVEVDLMIVTGAAQEGMKVDMGVVHIDAGVLLVDAGIGIKAKNGSRVSFIVSEVQLLNGGLGIGTRTAGGDPNFFSGNILYAKDDGTGVLLESRVTGDVINIQAGSLIVDTLYDMGANTTLNVFATEAAGSIVTDPTTTINSTLAGGDTNTKGWGFYVDDASSTQVFTTTDSKLLINGLASNTNEEFLPRNNGSIWDVATSKMIPNNVGASYDVRAELTVISFTGNPTQLTAKVDIGGMATPTNVIAEQTVTLKNSAPQSIVLGSPVFCLQTFVDNGAQLFLSTNIGSLTIEDRSILLIRTS